MQDQSTYLQKLKFNEKLNNSWIARYLSNPRLLILLLLSVTGLGLFSFFSLPRVLNPEIKIPIVIVSTVLPGASPEDIDPVIISASRIPNNMKNAINGCALTDLRIVRTRVPEGIPRTESLKR